MRLRSSRCGRDGATRGVRVADTGPDPGVTGGCAGEVDGAAAGCRLQLVFVACSPVVPARRSACHSSRSGEPGADRSGEACHDARQRDHRSPCGYALDRRNGRGAIALSRRAPPPADRASALLRRGAAPGSIAQPRSIRVSVGLAAPPTPFRRAQGHDPSPEHRRPCPAWRPTRPRVPFGSMRWHGTSPPAADALAAVCRPPGASSIPASCIRGRDGPSASARGRRGHRIGSGDVTAGTSCQPVTAGRCTEAGCADRVRGCRAGPRAGTSLRVQGRCHRSGRPCGARVGSPVLPFSGVGPPRCRIERERQHGLCHAVPQDRLPEPGRCRPRGDPRCPRPVLSTPAAFGFPVPEPCPGHSRGPGPVPGERRVDAALRPGCSGSARSAVRCRTAPDDLSRMDRPRVPDRRPQAVPWP